MTDALRTIACISLLMGVASALIVVIDLLAGHPQKMWIMNLVWPITALYAEPLALWVTSPLAGSRLIARWRKRKRAAKIRPERRNRSG